VDNNLTNQVAIILDRLARGHTEQQIRESMSLYYGEMFIQEAFMLAGAKLAARLLERERLIDECAAD
jgi:cytochrome c-type biogenesis protein CcmH/NrfF